MSAIVYREDWPEVTLDGETREATRQECLDMGLAPLGRHRAGGWVFDRHREPQPGEIPLAQGPGRYRRLRGDDARAAHVQEIVRGAEVDAEQPQSPEGRGKHPKMAHPLPHEPETREKALESGHRERVAVSEVRASDVVLTRPTPGHGWG